MLHAVDRRSLLGGAGLAAAAMMLPAAARASIGPAPQPEWMLGVADVMDDVSPRALRLVHGRAPAGLAGTLYRNGPARFRRAGSASGHWFDGDGLVRSWRIHDGSARLAARFVDTAKRRQEERLGRMVVPGFGTAASPGAEIGSNDDTNAANTAIIRAGDEMLALWEAGSPTAIDPETLATKGLRTLRSDLAHMPFLAHPRIEPDGRIWNLGLSGRRALVWRMSANGALESADLIDLPRASYMHDFTATARHLVIVLQPWEQDGFRLPYVDGLTWRPEAGTKILVIDKDDLSQRRIYDLPTFAFFHLGDAWEESDGTIRFDGCFETDPTFGATAARSLLVGQHVSTPTPILSMVALHPNGRGTVTSSGIGAEFPRVDPAQAGLPRTSTVHVGGYRPDRPFAQSVGVWNWSTGRDDSHDFGARHLVEEFVPVSAGRSGGQNWIIGTTVNLTEGASELHVFDVSRVSDGPLCSWRADIALPVSFHGTFVSA